MRKKKNSSKKLEWHSLASFIVFILAFSLRYQGIFKDTLPSLLVVVVMVLIGIKLLYHTSNKPSVIDLISLGAIYLLSFVDVSSGLTPALLNLGHLFLFAAFGYIMARLYKISFEFDIRSVKKVAIIVGVSLLFAYLFLLLNEPFPSYLQNSILLLIVYTFFVGVSEELTFRGVSFSLIKRNFPEEKAVHIQAIVFTIMHLLSIGVLFGFYAQHGSLLLRSPLVNIIVYAIALYAFSVIAARYAKGRKDVNIMYPILFHWLVNFLNLIVIF